MKEIKLQKIHGPAAFFKCCRKQLEEFGVSNKLAWTKNMMMSEKDRNMVLTYSKTNLMYKRSPN